MLCNLAIGGVCSYPLTRYDDVMSRRKQDKPLQLITDADPSADDSIAAGSSSFKQGWLSF